MTLPKITHPLIDLEIPSTKKKIKARPLLTKEEKILLMAKESAEASDIMAAVKQVVNNCIVTEGIDVDQLTIFDLELLFIKLRAVSINKIVKVSYIDNEDSKPYDFEVDLDTIEIKWPEGYKKTEDFLVKVDDNVSFQLRYPRASLFSDKEFMGLTGTDALEYLARNAIATVYSKDAAHPFNDQSEEDQKAFVADLPIKVFEKVRAFLSTLPTLYHVINYKNDKGSDRKIEMTTLSDFFTLD